MTCGKCQCSGSDNAWADARDPPEKVRDLQSAPELRVALVHGCLLDASQKFDGIGNFRSQRENAAPAEAHRSVILVSHHSKPRGAGKPQTSSMFSEK